MLTLRDIKKSYKTGDFEQHALNGISVSFRESEFVAILGPSGSGKTTCLNVIGGLDRYDSGDLLINGRSTKDYSNREWDAYRNHSIGFIFQSYNLIGHISVLANVELGMTLSGKSAAKRRAKAKEVLKRVGLEDHINKKPNQLSGGQMQRVAIARALANDPSIILADEPTGALDTQTSLQIMDLIKEISKDKLVIMVTHNPEIANKYADRIVKFEDGSVVSDSNPYEDETSKDETKASYVLKKTSMTYLTALGLSMRNILTKKGRTLLIAIASSIGITGIALILALSNGFDKKINNFERDTIISFPITVTQQAMEMDPEDMKAKHENGLEDFPKEQIVHTFDPEQESIMHMNVIDDKYIQYIESLDTDYVSSILYTRMCSFNFMSDSSGSAKPLEFTFSNYTALPYDLKEDASVMDTTYDCLYGKMPTAKDEVALVVDMRNRVSQKIMEALGIEGDDIAFENIIGTEFKWIPNDVFFKASKDGKTYLYNSDYESMYDSDKSMTIKITGILRIKEDGLLNLVSDGIAYPDSFARYVYENSAESGIVQLQKSSDYNVLTGQPIDTSTETGKLELSTVMTLIYGKDSPFMINIFPKDFNSKQYVIDALDKYNEGKDEETQIKYTDYAKMISKLSGNIMDAITIVLIAFSSISLFVSAIMIGIITYIAVLERTKEIGVLRSLGARRKDISRVFNSETFIIGMFSGFIGIVSALALTLPANMIIEHYSGLPGVAILNPLHAIVLVTISVAIAMIGGFIPAKLAARKDPVTALRSE